MVADSLADPYPSATTAPLPGRKPVKDRVALAGIVYVVRRGVSRADVPAERIGCSGVTCRRRLRDWTEGGLWPRLHKSAEPVSSTWTAARSTVPLPGYSRGELALALRRSSGIRT
ncbi:transposase [Streptomyces sp. NPDC021093]|uniref:transposase n=1 Tax=Streptomyces sp. NPDC021093 TaxID=3365112 RepID=UPI0037BBE8A6